MIILIMTMIIQHDDDANHANDDNDSHDDDAIHTNHDFTRQEDNWWRQWWPGLVQSCRLLHPIMSMMIMIIMMIHANDDDAKHDADANDDQVWCSLVISSVPSLLALLAVEQENIITKVNFDGMKLWQTRSLGAPPGPNS